MTKNISIHWFRQDLRLHDNPSLTLAAKSEYIMPIYIFDNCNAENDKMGAASKVWLYYSLQSLKNSLKGKLSIYIGNPVDILKQLVSHYKINSIYWNRCYEPWQINRDQKIKEYFISRGVAVKTTNGALLQEPWEVLKLDRSPYKVFTPFYRNLCMQSNQFRVPIKKPNLQCVYDEKHTVDISDIKLLPQNNWHDSVISHWNVGESKSQLQLKKFLNNRLSGYQKGRDFPSLDSTSKLSAALHFGELSPNIIWYLTQESPETNDREHFLRELVWREFSYSQLYYFKTLSNKNWNAKFDDFPWNKNQIILNAWQKGVTGIPLVDAGMRELWQTGTMHNRVRMVCASFLVKNCLIDWRKGAEWFWACLFDADLASNSASWQWVAGCGADAAPYFRIFNPVTQAKNFDPNGLYIRKFIPELKQLPTKNIFAPWEASKEILHTAKLSLGKDYPYPIVNLKLSREKALDSYKSLKYIQTQSSSQKPNACNNTFANYAAFCTS